MSIFDIVVVYIDNERTNINYGDAHATITNTR